MCIAYRKLVRNPLESFQSVYGETLAIPNLGILGNSHGPALNDNTSNAKNRDECT